MTRSFEPHPAFRVVKGLLSPPAPVIRAVAGRPVVIDGQTLDPYLQYMLSMINQSPRGVRPMMGVEQRRELNLRGARLAMPQATGVLIEDRVIEGGGGSIALRVFRSDNLAGSPPVLLYFHGGGFVVGSIETHEALARMLARATRAVVVSVGYRLAPEHPYPAAVQDCVAAYDWVMTHSTALGVRPQRVAVAGDSAGGALAAVVSKVVRDRGTTAPPIAQALLYPVTDLRMVDESYRLFADGFFLTADDVRWFRANYAPRGFQWTDPRVSPALDDRFDGLPPTRIWTAGFDPLRDEGERYGALLADAGVVSTTTRDPSMIHGYLSMGLVPGGMRRTVAMCRDVGTLVWAHAGL